MHDVEIESDSRIPLQRQRLRQAGRRGILQRAGELRSRLDQRDGGTKAGACAHDLQVPVENDEKIGATLDEL